MSSHQGAAGSSVAVDAWRIFNVEHGWLVAPMARHIGTEWTPGVNNATCNKSHRAPAPAASCTCGIHACLELDQLILYATRSRYGMSFCSLMVNFPFIARVRLSGNILPTVDSTDTPTTVRASHAELLELHLPMRRRPELNKLLPRYPNVTFVVHPPATWSHRPLVDLAGDF